jgi:hypothetical protein
MADNGQRTTGVTTFAESGNNGFGEILGNLGGNLPRLPATTQTRDSIDLRPFLSTKDGGTATQLRTLTPDRDATSDPNKLNPNRFR